MRPRGAQPRTREQVAFAALLATYQAIDLSGVDADLDRGLAMLKVFVAGRKLDGREDADAALVIAGTSKDARVHAIAEAARLFTEAAISRDVAGLARDSALRRFVLSLARAISTAPREVYPDAAPGEF